jgi:hypothetical protein
MNFYELYNKIKENKKYQIIADYIVENDVNIESFLNSILNSILTEDKKQGFFTRQLQGLGGSLDKFKGKIGNMWNRFRGNPTDVNSVIQILEKAREFLSKDPEMQKNYDNEISNLAKTIEDIRNKGSKPVDATMRPETETGAKPTTDSPPDTDKLQEYLRRFTYGAPIETLDSRKDNNHKIYATELASYPNQKEIESVKDILMKSLQEKVSLIENNGILLKTKSGNVVFKPNEGTTADKWKELKEKYLNHETWALWDIGKQMYMSKNPSASGEGYRLGNPLKDANIQNDIVNRMIGWAVTGGINLITGRRLSSKDLIIVGSRACDKKPLFDEIFESNPLAEPISDA